jgi:hypothetical protein
MRDGVTYQELGADYFDRRNHERAVRRHVKQLEALGFQPELTAIPTTVRGVADIVQCGLRSRNAFRRSHLDDPANTIRRKSLTLFGLRMWLLRLDSNQQPSG